MAWWIASERAQAVRAAHRAGSEGRTLAAARAGRDAIQAVLATTDSVMLRVQMRQQALARGEARAAERHEADLMAQTWRGQDGFCALASADASGTVTWTSRAGWLPGWVGNTEYFLSLRHGGLPAWAGRGPGSSPNLLVTRALAGRDGTFAGAGLACLDANRLGAVLPATQSAADPQVALVQGNGAVVARGRASAPSWTALPRAGAPEARGTGEQAGSREDPALGRLVAQASAGIPGYDLVVVAALDDAAAVSEAERAALLGYGPAAALLLLTAGAGLLLWQSRPLPAAPDITPPVPGQRAVAALIAAPQPTFEEPLPAPGGDAFLSDPKVAAIPLLPIAVYAARVTPAGRWRLVVASQALTSLGRGLGVTFADQDRWRRAVEHASDLSGTPLAEQLLRAEPNAPAISVEYRLVRPDGESVWLREVARVVSRHAAGVDVLGTLADVTRERSLSEQAAAATRGAARGTMAAGLAHELNQPLTVMSLAAENALEALEEGWAGIPDAQARLRRIASQAQRAKAIAAQLRSLARLDAVALEPVRLLDAARSALAVLGEELRAAGIVPRLDVPAELPPVRGQKLLIEQVLVNLCTNARDALLTRPEGTRHLHLSAEVLAEEDEVLLRVVDSGGGLPPGAAERAFDPFFTTKPPEKGTGLGLALCRSIMQRLGGTVTLANLGTGAEAQVTFRIARSAHRDPGGAVQGTAPAGDARGGETLPRR